MLYTLDTDSLSLYERGFSPITERIRRVLSSAPETLSVTVITVEEQISGWYDLLRRAKTTEELASAYQSLGSAVELLSGLPILPFTAPAILRYDALVKQKLNVGKYDLRIAAVALEFGATLITRNARDFSRIPGLTTEDWTTVTTPA